MATHRETGTETYGEEDGDPGRGGWSPRERGQRSEPLEA